MKKVKQTQNETNDVAALSYNLVYKVSIPMNESTIDSDTETVTNYVVSALEAVSKEVQGIKLEQSLYYGSAPVNIPIIEKIE